MGIIFQGSLHPKAVRLLSQVDQVEPRPDAKEQSGGLECDGRCVLDRSRLVGEAIVEVERELEPVLARCSTNQPMIDRGCTNN